MRIAGNFCHSVNCLLITAICMITSAPLAAQVTRVSPFPEDLQLFRAEQDYLGCLYASSAALYSTLLDFRSEQTSSLPIQSERIRYQTAISHLNSNSVLLADHYAATLLQTTPRSHFYDSYAYSVRGIVRVREHDFAGAASMFQLACTAAENHATNDVNQVEHRRFCLFWQANSLLLSGASSNALKVYQNIAQDAASEFADDAMYAIGQIRESQMDNDAALRAYMSIIERYNSQVESRLELRGSSHFEKYNSIIPANIRAAQCLLRRWEVSNALTRLAAADEILAERGKHDSVSRAVPERKGELRWSGIDERSMIRYLRGEALHALGLFEGATVEFDFVTKQDVPTDLKDRASFGLGAALMARQLWKESITAFDSILVRSPSLSGTVTSLALIFKGIATKQFGDRRTALEIFRSSAASEQCTLPDRALLEMGQMFYEDEQYDSAKIVLERAEYESRDPRTGIRSNVVLGSIYMLRGEWRLARSCYDKAEILGKKISADVPFPRSQFDDEIHLKRGIAHYNDAQYREAINDLTAYLGRHPDDERADEALFWLAETFFRAQLMKNATDSYRRLIENFASSKRREEALYGLGWTLFKTRNFDSAGVVFGTMLTEFPESGFAGDVFVRKGDALYLTKRYTDAVSAYRSAVRVMIPGDLSRYAEFQIGQSLYRAKEYVSAIRELELFVEHYSSSDLADHALYTVGYIYSLLDKHTEALPIFEQLTKRYPTSELVPASLYYAANAAYALGNYNDAADRYRGLMGLYPTTYFGIEALRGLQESLSLLGRNDEAIEAGKAYLSANPDGSVREQISMKTIEIFMRKGDYGSAAREYQEFLKKYPDSDLSAEALFLLAKSQMGMNDIDAARQTLLLLYSKHERSDFAAQGLMQLALLELRRANVSRADSLLTIVHTKYDRSELAAHALYEQAGLAMGKGDTLRSLSLYRQCGSLRLGEYSNQSDYRVGMFYRAQGIDDSARAIFKHVSSVTDNQSLAAECVYRIGESHLTLRQYEEALKAFEEVRNSFDSVEDWYTLSLIGLGECYEKTGNLTKARETYQTVIILHPSDDFGLTAQSRLKRLRKE